MTAIRFIALRLKNKNLPENLSVIVEVLDLSHRDERALLDLLDDDREVL